MKKNVFKILLVAAFMMAAGYSVYSSQQDAEMSDLALANVEALAQNESNSEQKYEIRKEDSLEVWDDRTGTFKKKISIECEGEGCLDC